MNQAALTGESMPVGKVVTEGPIGSTDPVDATNAVFHGSFVTGGAGVAVVARTGAATEFGHIASRLAARPPEAEFERGMRQFAVLITQTVVTLVLFVFLVNALLRRDPLTSFLFAVALAVGLTPEFLPMIVTVTLARGAVHMARRKVIVRNLAAIQNLGSMEVLCSDKTGTLTVGAVSVADCTDATGRRDTEVLRLAALNSAHQTGLRSPLDAAILAAPHPVVDGQHRLDEVPFDFTRRCLSVVVGDNRRRLLVTKGAPESLLPRCVATSLGDGNEPLDANRRALLDERFRRWSADGFRVLAIAHREVGDQTRYGPEDERALILDGFVTFVDPIQPDAPAAITALKRDGVIVKVLSGDNELVVSKVARAVGLDATRILVGAEVGELSDAALGVVAERTALFARVSPAQKERILHALKARGHVVGFLGDGINDAPSLRAADVGISVATATDIARDAAEIVLSEHWDVRFIQRFMLTFGPLSSLFDFATFAVMLWAFHASAVLFRTGWFVESLATQTLVIFVIRTRRSPLHSRPSRALVASTLAAVAAGLVIAVTPLGFWLGFTPPPPAFLGIVGAMALVYLTSAELLKRGFYRHHEV